ncbi:MAG TPA: prephenate dehydrogenase/arogenate dehydrogenase family protein [Anaerolineales bacterium]|nr:prephenate dehydrogenase/arogenate dehydrogenase family protein [Anaerolineales bacterium]
MPTTIGIIGLGQIGGSIGLALKQRNAVDRVLGTTRSASTGRAALTLGAVDAVVGLAELARDSQIIFLALPHDQVRTTLELMQPRLKDNSILLDTAPIRSQVNKWVGELLPAGAHHIGLVPAPNPSMLVLREWGVKAAHADFFNKSTVMLVASPRTTGAVEELAITVVRLLGAKPLLTDPMEADGLMTTAHLLPQLTSSALIEASVGVAGWQEARKLAGRPFAQVTGGMAYFDDPGSVVEATLANSKRVVHGIDVLIAALRGLRDEVDAENAGQLTERLRHSYMARERWLNERNDAEWLDPDSETRELPGLGEHLTHLFFGGKIAEATRAVPSKRPAR